MKILLEIPFLQKKREFFNLSKTFFRLERLIDREKGRQSVEPIYKTS